MKAILGLVLVCALMLSAGCILPSDIRALEDNYTALDRGKISLAEFDTANAKVYETIEKRNEEIKAAAMDVPTDPVEVVLWAGGILTAILGESKRRDWKREKRGEPTGTAPKVG